MFAAKLIDESAVESSQPVVAKLTTVPSGATEDHEVTAQLESLYADVEYLTRSFPDHSIRSLTDYARSLEAQSLEQKQKAIASGAVEDHGLIPGAVFAQLGTLSQELADSASTVGIVEVDDSGVIKTYNQYEAELAGVEKKAVFGRNFFTDVAPCTNNRLFLGAFKQGVQTNSIDKKFNYTFTYKMKPTPVVIQIYRDTGSKRNFIFVQKR
ncbi:MAG: PAS domain-containing protein [Methylotenera sp.]|nr:PAS domain-containing protein [Oligoflexia bacterium]